MPDTPPPIRKPGPRREPAEPIRADECYDQAAFLKRVGWSRAALTTARRSGLRAQVAGGRLWIKGAWFLSYLDLLNDK